MDERFIIDTNIVGDDTGRDGEGGVEVKMIEKLFKEEFIKG